MIEPTYIAKHRSRSPIAKVAFIFVYVLIVLALGRWYFERNIGYAVDDSFITFRYAFNLVRGYGLVFNVGEEYYGTTAAGYAVLLAVGAAISSALSQLTIWKLTLLQAVPLVSTAVATISIVTLALLLPIVAKAQTDWRQWLLAMYGAVLLLAALPFNQVAGHETYPFIAAAFVGSVLIGYYRAYVAGSLFFAMAATFRPDAILFAAIVPFLDWARSGESLFAYVKQPRIIAAALLYLAILGSWMGYLGWHFGTPMPGTMAAKHVQVALGYWPKYTPSTVVKYIASSTSPNELIFAAIGWLGFLCSLGPALARAGRSSPEMFIGGVWLVFAVVSATAYCIFNVTFWDWYGVPLFFSLLVVAFAGWVRLNQWVGCVLWPRSFADLNHGRVAASLTPIVVLCLFSLDGYTALSTWLQTRNVNTHIAAYSEIVDYLHKDSPDGATIQTTEPGSLGYHLGPKYMVVDELGLISPGVAQALARRDFGWTFSKWHPKYVVCSWHGDYTACDQGLQKASYDLVGDFDRDFWMPYLKRGAELWRLKENAH